MASARLEFAIEAVRAAARRIRRFEAHRSDIKVEYKAPGDPVTNADLAVEAIVLDKIAERYPDDGTLSEESGSSGNQDSCWVLDPIDGTTNFIHGLPDYAVSLAWCKNGKPELGVIYDICRDEIYSAERSRGAYCEQRRIRIAETRQMSAALIGSTGSPGTGNWRWAALAEASSKSAGFRRLGSATIEFALTARSSLTACFGANLSYWDYAAGSVILAEAGGVYTDLEGKAEVPFGAKLGVCIFGAPRIVGNLRRLATAHKPKVSKD